MRRHLGPALVAAIALGACSDPSPVDDTFSGELTDDDSTVEQDQSKYDEYAFEAGERWTITVDMQSEEFDSYLWLLGPTDDGVRSLVQDDDSGEHLNARLSWETRHAGRYIVRANGATSSDRGAYTVHVVATPGQ